MKRISFGSIAVDFDKSETSRLVQISFQLCRLGGLEGVDANGQKRSFHLSDYRYS